MASRAAAGLGEPLAGRSGVCFGLKAVGSVVAGRDAWLSVEETTWEEDEGGAGSEFRGVGSWWSGGGEWLAVSSVGVGGRGNGSVVENESA